MRRGAVHEVGVGDVGQRLDPVDDPRAGPYERRVGIDRPDRDVRDGSTPDATTLSANSLAPSRR